MFSLNTIALAQHGSPPTVAPRTYEIQPLGDAGAQEWRDDLHFLYSSLKRIHPNPFWKTQENVLDAAVGQLKREIPELSAHQVIVRMAEILAMVGDGHTSLPVYFADRVDFHVLPVRFGVYEDGIWVEAAAKRYENLVGGRVVSIAGVEADAVMSRVATLVSRDNENWIAAVAPSLLNRIEVLHALGLADDLNSARVRVSTGQDEVDALIFPLKKPVASGHGLPFLPEYSRDWVDARDSTTNSVPRYQQSFDQIYGWEYFKDTGTLYIKWDQVQNRAHGPSALDIFGQAMSFARITPPARTIIDIRNNTGGEGGLLPPVVREIIRTPGVDEPGKLFVIIGKRTFSAGQMFTAMLETYSSALLVGEPSSALYNGYAGHEFSRMPNSGISFAISPDYYQLGAFPRDTRTQATPRLAAIPTFEDYKGNIDRAMQVVEQYQHGRFESEINVALDEGDLDGLKRIVDAWTGDPVNRYRRAQTQINAMAYQLLRDHDAEGAGTLFRLNVELHPQYANGWDSLGEFLLRHDNREQAVKAYRKALELDPGLQSARQALSHLGVNNVKR